MSFQNDRYRIRYASANFLREYRCPVCGKPVQNGWAVFDGDAPLCSACAAEAAPDLVKLVPLIDPGDLPSRAYGVRRSAEVTATGGTALCAESQRIFTVRALEVAVGTGRLVSPAAAEDRAPALASALHVHFGTEPEPHPEPLPPPPSPEDRAAERHRAAVKVVAGVLNLPEDRADLLVREIRALAA